MAFMNQASLANILLDKYGALITSSLTQYGPGNWLVPEQSMIGRLQQAGRVFIGGADGNDQYPREWGVHAASPSGASFAADDAFPSATNETYAQARLDWKRVGIMMESDNLQRVLRNGGIRGAILPIIQEFQSKAKSLISTVESQLFLDGTGNSGKDVTGAKAFLSASNTYAGIDQGTNSWWRAAVSNAGGAALSESLMDGVAATLYQRNGISPRFEIWMGIKQYQRFTNLFKDRLHFVPGGSTQAPIPMYSSAGINAPVLLMQNVPDSEVWFVNLDELELRFLDHSPIDELGGKDASANREGVPMGIESVFTGKDIKAFYLKVYTNLVCQNPYHQGALINLAS